MESQIKISVTHTSEGYGVKISSPDTDAFTYAISELKNTVPSSYRTYNPIKKVWTITDSGCLNDWLYEMRRVYNINTDYTGAYKPPQPPPAQSLSSPFTTLHLLPSAPPEVIKAAYKALARIHHPDARGDAAKMIEINRAYETLTQGK
jgi:hypothetical protein